jgi:hypothetical protein
VSAIPFALGLAVTLFNLYLALRRGKGELALAWGASAGFALAGLLMVTT